MGIRVTVSDRPSEYCDASCPRVTHSHYISTGEKKEPPDLVNHPPHYTAHPSGVECIQITEHMNFNVGNAIKYLWRAGLKEGTEGRLDLLKAKWYVQREIDRLGGGGKG